jgi:DNA-binding NarL/FixJ family response regulator
VGGFQTAEAIRRLYRGHRQPRIVAWLMQNDEESIQKAWRHNIDEIVLWPVACNLLEEILSETFE